MTIVSFNSVIRFARFSTTSAAHVVNLTHDEVLTIDTNQTRKRIRIMTRKHSMSTKHPHNLTHPPRDIVLPINYNNTIQTHKS